MRKKMFGLTAAAVCLAMLAGCGAGGGEAAQPYTKEQAQEILDSGIFTYTLDIAHCDSPDEGMDILRRVDAVSKLHISNRIGGLYHTPLYDGDFDFTELLPALRSYHLPMVLEGYDPQGGLDVFYRNVEFLQEHLMQLQCRIS